MEGPMVPCFCVKTVEAFRTLPESHPVFTALRVAVFTIVAAFSALAGLAALMCF